MEIYKIVPTLEKLAHDRAYAEILQDLELCYGHGPAGNRFYLRSPECEVIRDHVWSQIEQKVVGLKSDQVRKDFVKSYYKCLKNRGAESNIVVDTWLFLDTVLDDSFKELEIHATLPGKEASYQLMQIIADRSPLLTKLTIDFTWMGRADDSRENERKFEAVIQSLASLHNLTDLHLMGMSNREDLLMHSLFGEVSPQLSSLRVSDSLYRGGHSGRDDKFILALIMGKYAGLFHAEDRPSWCEISQLERIDVPAEFRTKICSSLRVLQLGCLGYCSPAAAAFLLRNIPLLQKWDGLESLCDGIELLHRGQQESNSFRGQLSLTTVSGVNVKSRKSLRAVGGLCSSLEEVTFSDWFDEEVKPADFVSSDELKIILSKWPKPTVISLYAVSHVYVKSILEVFGPVLKHLDIERCEEDGRRVLKVAHFALCPRLERLSISYSTFEETEDVSFLDLTTFLPHLKSFKSDDCMGRFSPYFEEKATLVHLDISCSHVRMDIAEELPRNCRLNSLKEFQKMQFKCELDRIHAFWGQLETLSIYQFAGLSMKEMVDLLPRLRKLKKVFLPQSISACDVLLYETMKNELSNRRPPGVASFKEFEYTDYDDCVLNI